MKTLKAVWGKIRERHYSSLLVRFGIPTLVAGLILGVPGLIAGVNLGLLGNPAGGAMLQSGCNPSDGEARND